MPVTVVDASAVGALLFDEPDGARVAERLAGASLAAPSLLGFEVANICLTKMRRHPGMRSALITAYGMLARMEIDTVEVDHAETLLLAERTALTVYDASYLWLAETFGGGLITLDKQLAAAHAALRKSDRSR